ncbi:thermostable direct hemolysin-family toxin [Vibrio parahaemolyticus]|nr:thermostable direct hemolysin-family toxin [Vibrio parahaemolyticus]EGR2938282.1 thermostable direct hemolysin [Vibrio parahaemolyticus]EJG0166479.1 thermostable direct hemolysin-family toxin [Vibrio parahaemolyticus]EJG0241528.1 thermostable direct hemolysin-family toxin [Vibrio parahaemolyticus]EJG0255827.1 thermostable direct hemolysin-family toxin [Vibrio parahaemolyticus]
MKLKLYFAFSLILVSMFSVSKSFAIDLPSIPFPSPGSAELLFVVRNTTIKTESPVKAIVEVYWTNRNIKRKPYKDVYGQSVFTTAGSKWLSAYMTVNINGHNYTMAALSGYKDGISTVFTKSEKTSLKKDFSSIKSFVDVREESISIITYLDETPEHVVTVNEYEGGNGHMFVV